MSGSSGVAVGLVGCGEIAETHLAVLAGVEGAELVFVVDPRRPEVSEFKGTTPPLYDGLGEALARHEVDLVVIATPTDTHADLVCLALTETTATVLVEKPLVHDLAGLDQIRSLAPTVDLDKRLHVAHHFAFSPEVTWAADQLTGHPEWGPVTRITTVFHDPYIVDTEHAFAAYLSAWIDSGPNQLSMLTRFVELTGRGDLHESGDRASVWCSATFRARPPAGAEDGTALLRASWDAVATSKRTTVYLDHTGTEIWLDHTAVTALVVHDGQITAQLTNDGRTPRKIAHYRPLYQSLLAAAPDPALSFTTAETVIQLLHGHQV